MGLRAIGTAFFLMLASITMQFSVDVYQGTTTDENSPVVSGCWNDQTEIIVGGNPPYCSRGTFRSVLDSLEVSEDQHIRETGEDWETGFTVTSEYRWEDVGESVVYGFIRNGGYDCWRYVPEFALPDDWVPTNIDSSFEYPEWCGTSVENQDTRVYEEGAHPYDDVWMYNAQDVGAMSSFLHAHKTTEDWSSWREYIAKSMVEQDRAEWGAEGEFGLGVLFFTVPVTFLFLFAADQRPHVFVVDRQAKTIIRRRSGRYPSFSRTWSDVDFSATVAALEKALAIDLTGDLVDFVSRLSLATLSAIQDADYTFQLLMPEDDGSLEERLLSIAEWSRGFLSGFTQGITLREAAGEPIPTMTAEALKDMAAIAQVETEEADSEDAERQLEDIIEYIRFAAINIVNEAQSLQEGNSENLQS